MTFDAIDHAVDELVRAVKLVAFDFDGDPIPKRKEKREREKREYLHSNASRLEAQALLLSRSSLLTSFF